jgi:hypothetical protein
MNITLSLSSEQETELRNSLMRRDRIGVRQILTDAIDPAIDTLLETDSRLNPVDFERLANDLIKRVSIATGGQTPTLRDEDIDRAGIYRDHA